MFKIICFNKTYLPLNDCHFISASVPCHTPTSSTLLKSCFDMFTNCFNNNYKSKTSLLQKKLIADLFTLTPYIQ